MPKRTRRCVVVAVKAGSRPVSHPRAISVNGSTLVWHTSRAGSSPALSTRYTMGCEMYWLHSSLARKLRGSIPTRSTHLLDVKEHHAHVVQWLEHFPVKEEVAGSSPVVCAGTVA